MTEMKEQCPVCQTDCEEDATACSICGFADELGINRTWVIKEDASNWLETVVKHYRVQYEAKKRENDLLAQLEEAKQREAKLLAQLEAAKQRETEVEVPITKATDVEISNFNEIMWLINNGNRLEAIKILRSSGLGFLEAKNLVDSTQCNPEKIKALLKTRGSFTDFRDGYVYRTVKIGSQVWMAENLNYNAPDSKCYDNDFKNIKKYGRFYDWDIAMKVVPSGWHLPSNDEWQKLIDFVGGDKVAEEKLKAKIGWDSYSNGTDEYGFSALPSGYGNSDGNFEYVGDYGVWWNASNKFTYSSIHNCNIDIGFIGVIYKFYYRTALCPIRCLQNKTHR